MNLGPAHGTRRRHSMHWFCRNCKILPVPAVLSGWTSTSQRAAPTRPSVGRRFCFMDYRPYDPRERDSRIRWELVHRIRQEIAAGTYETPEKLEKALERLLDEVKRD